MKKYVMRNGVVVREGAHQPLDSSRKKKAKGTTMKLFTKAFWADLAERTTATAAQSAIAVLAVESGLAEVDWSHVGSIAGLAALIAGLKCFALIRRTADENG